MKNYKLQITVTKEILKRSMMCGVDDAENITENCAIALAIRDVFPRAYVGCEKLFFGVPDLSVKLPYEAAKYVRRFDSLRDATIERLDLPEITFEVEVPDEVIDKIDISKIYEGHPTLQLIEIV